MYNQSPNSSHCSIFTIVIVICVLICLAHDYDIMSCALDIMESQSHDPWQLPTSKVNGKLARKIASCSGLLLLPTARAHTHTHTCSCLSFASPPRFPLTHLWSSSIHMWPVLALSGTHSYLLQRYWNYLLPQVTQLYVTSQVAFISSESQRFNNQMAGLTHPNILPTFTGVSASNISQITKQTLASLPA